MSEPLLKDQRRIGELIATLEALPDPEARACAKELVQGILALHAVGIERLLAILTESGEPGRTALEVMALDRSVSALLLLHGVHPHDLSTRVLQAVNKLQVEHGAQGIRIELLDASGSSVRVKLSGRWQGKSFSPQTLTHEIEQAILEFAPDVAAIEIEGMEEINVHPIKFMPASARHDARASANQTA